LTGTVSDSRLTGNVALRNANQTFTGQNTFSGPVSLRAVQAYDAFTLNQNDILLKDDDKHGLGYYGASKLFGGFGFDGPVLYGYSGGALGTKTFETNTVALTWNNAGKVGIGNSNTPASLDVYGTVTIRSNLVVWGSISNAGVLTSPSMLASSISVSMKQVTSVSANMWTKVGDIGTFTKTWAGSVLEVTYSGRLGLNSWGSGATGADFELRVDNVAVPSGRARATIVPSDSTSYGAPGPMTGIFTGLSTGSHTVSVWVYPYGGSGNYPTVNPGAYAGAHLVIKEFK
jgi:hypothetical protein